MLPHTRWWSSSSQNVWPGPSRCCGRGSTSPGGSSNGVRSSITSDSPAAVAPRKSPTSSSGDSSPAASITTRRHPSHPDGQGAAAPTRACRPSAVGPRPPCQSCQLVDEARRAGCGSGCGSRSGSSGSAGVACSAQHWRTSAGRACAPPQYTHEITPATLTTGCDGGGERGVLPGPHLDRFQMKATDVPAEIHTYR